MIQRMNCVFSSYSSPFIYIDNKVLVFSCMFMVITHCQDQKMSTLVYLEPVMSSSRINDLSMFIADAQIIVIRVVSFFQTEVSS